jgi:hypothetical protein
MRIRDRLSGMAFASKKRIFCKRYIPLHLSNNIKHFAHACVCIAPNPIRLGSHIFQSRITLRNLANYHKTNNSRGKLNLFVWTKPVAKTKKIVPNGS